MQERLALLALAVVGCSHAKEIEAAHHARIATIDRECEHYAAEARAAWNPVIAKAKQTAEDLRKKLVQMGPDGVTPVSRVNEDQAVKGMAEICEQLPPDQQEQCASLARDLYRDEFAKRYAFADVEWVTTKLAEKPDSDMEALVAYSHNRRIEERANEVIKQATDQLAQALSEIEEYRGRAIGLSESERDRSLAQDRERRRELARSIGEGLSAYGAAMQSRNTAPATQAYKAVELGCLSDLQCGFGRKCLKANYSSSGTCVDVVDQFGSKQIARPPGNTIAPKLPSPTDCRFDTQCPSGFRCDRASGACVR